MNCGWTYFFYSGMMFVPHRIRLTLNEGCGVCHSNVILSTYQGLICLRWTSLIWKSFDYLWNICSSYCIILQMIPSVCEYMQAWSAGNHKYKGITASEPYMYPSATLGQHTVIFIRMGTDILPKAKLLGHTSRKIRKFSRMRYGLVGICKVLHKGKDGFRNSLSKSVESGREGVPAGFANAFLYIRHKFS